MRFCLTLLYVSDQNDLCGLSFPKHIFNIWVTKDYLCTVWQLKLSILGIHTPELTESVRMVNRGVTVAHATTSGSQPQMRAEPSPA